MGKLRKDIEYKMIIRSKNISVYLDSPLKSLKFKLSELLPRYIPVNLPKQHNEKYDYVVHIRSGCSSLTIGELELSYSGIPGKSLYPLDVVALLSSLFEALFLSKGLASVHSTAVAKGSSCLLIVGKSGVGKTSLGINLIKEFGFSYFKNERVIINDSSQVVTGIRKIELSPSNISQVKDSLSKSKHIQDGEVLVEPEEISIDEFASSPLRLDYIVFPFLKAGDLSVDNKSSLYNLFQLYKNSFYFDKMYKPVLYGLEREVPSFSSLHDPSDRLRICKKAMDSCKTIHISGNLKSVSKYISNLIT